MSVEELIQILSKVEDKSIPVTLWNAFSDQMSTEVYVTRTTFGHDEVTMDVIHLNTMVFQGDEELT